MLVAVKVSTCGVSNPLQGEADDDKWRLGKSDGKYLEVMLEAVKSKYLWRVQSSPERG